MSHPMVGENEQVAADVAADATPKEKPKPKTTAEILSAHLESLQSYHWTVLQSEDVEAIHKLRVTTRRLQAVLDTLQAGAARSKIERIKRRLRRWRQQLSSVRNYDVFLQLMDRELQARRGVRREQMESLRKVFLDRRAKQSAEMRDYLSRHLPDEVRSRLVAVLGCVRLQSDVTSDITELPDGVVGAAPAAAVGVTATFLVDEKQVASRIADRLEQRLAEFQVLAVQALPSTKAEDLHQLRIAAKRLRYLTEIVEEMGHGSGGSALTWLRTLQDRIGDWHDLESLEAEIVAVVCRPTFLRDHLAESSQMLQAAAHLQKKKRALVSKLFPVRVPGTVATTATRMSRAMRRVAAGQQPSRRRRSLA